MVSLAAPQTMMSSALPGIWGDELRLREEERLYSSMRSPALGMGGYGLRTSVSGDPTEICHCESCAGRHKLCPEVRRLLNEASWSPLPLRTYVRRVICTPWSFLLKIKKCINIIYLGLPLNLAYFSYWWFWGDYFLMNSFTFVEYKTLGHWA